MEVIDINTKSYIVVRSSDPITMKSKTGTKTWIGHIVADAEGLPLLTSSWFNRNDKTGNTSVVQWAEPYPVTVKNVGRSNETAVDEQALLEFDSMVKKESDKRTSERPLPMLAQTFQKRGAKYIKYPAAVQPKLNGMRMLSDGKTAWSRGGKDIIPECVAHLQFDSTLTDRLSLVDGELILKDNPLLQETMKVAKKYRKGLSENLQYHVYDTIPLAHPDVSFATRLQAIHAFVKEVNNPNIVLVETRIVNNYEEVIAAHHDFVRQGFEGTMVRNFDSVYEINQRSNGLQKLKDMQDGEWKIVNVIEGDGSFKGCAIFVCETEAGLRFNCTPEGTTEARREMYQDRAQHINHFLNIRYQELSNDKIPLFPVGITVRVTGEF